MGEALSVICDIAGYIYTEFESESKVQTRLHTEPILNTLVHVNDGFAVTCDFSGTFNLELESEIKAEPSIIKQAAVIKAVESESKCFGHLTENIQFIRQFESKSKTCGEFELTVNQGITTEVLFGNVILSNATPADFIDSWFPSRERVLWNGTKALQTSPGSATTHKFLCATENWNEIVALENMRGGLYTLRIYGKPYRNCIIWPPFRHRVIRWNVALWVYEITIKEDTSRSARTS